MKLGRDFFSEDTVSVAKNLVGKELVRETECGILTARITETEAYHGPEDKASHAFGNKLTARTRVMFEAPGSVYVYLIYGMYHCLNFVTGKKGFPAAVLIRSVKPLQGISFMKKFRNRKLKNLRDMANGPSKLCMAMNINRDLNGLDSIMSNEVYIKEGSRSENFEIAAKPRINIDYAKEYALKPWRFFEKGSLFLSH